MTAETQEQPKTEAALPLPPTEERGRWRAHARVEVWHGCEDAAAIEKAKAEGRQPDEVREADGNSLLTAGITRMLNLLIAGGGQGLDNTHCRIGVGNGTTAVTVADTDLSASAGSANRWFQVADSTYPQVSSNVLTVRATFASANGNFSWQEWGIDFGTASGNTVTAPLLNRKVVDLGTKVSAASVVFTVTITQS